MGHGNLYQSNWRELLQEDQSRDYARYFRRKRYPKAFVIALMFLTALSLIFRIMWGLEETATEKLEESCRGMYGYEVSVLPPKDPMLAPLEVVTEPVEGFFDVHDSIPFDFQLHK